MSDEIANRIRRENYLIEIYASTNDKWFVTQARRIIDFVRKVYRTIEPSHYGGTLIVNSLTDLGAPIVERGTARQYYDSGMLNHYFSNIIFEIYSDDSVMPNVWTNQEQTTIDRIVNNMEGSLSYVFNGEEQTECFYVNGVQVGIQNSYSCPSIFALQYHDLIEALYKYHSTRARNVSCEHLKNCFQDENFIYFKNKPEDCIQVSLSEFLKSHLRGVDVSREFNLGASKPVDVRVYWREANRSALIEVKWLGRSLKENGNIGTSYTNTRVNDGMSQIKEYMDLSRRDNPDIISKGYLVLIDGRRRGINQSVVTSISREDGYHYSGSELNVHVSQQFWLTYPEISEFLRMFVEPICT